MSTLWDRFLGRVDDETSTTVSTIDVDELVEKYEWVANAGDAMIVKAADAPGTGQKVDIRELGRTDTVIGAIDVGEYNAKLIGYGGLRKYDEMRRSDAQVRGSLRIVKTPILSGRWFIQPASESPRDQEIADFVWWNLEEGMSISFSQLMVEALLMLDFGYYPFEKVFDIRDTPFGPRVVWQKFAARSPLSIMDWEFDKHGGPKRMLYGADQVPIPMSKLLVFTFDREGGNITGISILRSAYKHWFYKETLYKIDAIQKERHGIGVPIIVLPPNFTSDGPNSDLRVAQELGANLRANEKAHVVLPPNWDLYFAKLEGQKVDALESAKHHGDMIYENVMAQFMTMTGDTKSQEATFAKGTGYIAEIIRDVLNKYAIPQLVDYNWLDVTRYPKLKVRRIGDTTDWRTHSFAVRNYIGAGALTPDDRLEEHIRDEMDLPRRDEATSREVAAPQARVGPPRQSTATGNTQGKRPGGEGRGTDQSGGN